MTTGGITSDVPRIKINEAGTLQINTIKTNEILPVPAVPANQSVQITGNLVVTGSMTSGAAAVLTDSSGYTQAAANAKFATLTGSETLTNKTLTDASITIQDDIDITKKARFDAGSISHATTRTYTLPNANGTLVTTGDTGTVTNTMLQTISATGKVANSATTATNSNIVSTIVARDASGNFAAGTITAALSGNASTATTLQTARTINGVSFDGSANITVADANKLPLAGGTIAGDLAVTGNLSVTGFYPYKPYVAFTLLTTNYSTGTFTVESYGHVAITAAMITRVGAGSMAYRITLPTGQGHPKGGAFGINVTNQTEGSSTWSDSYYAVPTAKIETLSGVLGQEISVWLRKPAVSQATSAVYVHGCFFVLQPLNFSFV